MGLCPPRWRGADLPPAQRDPSHRTPPAQPPLRSSQAYPPLRPKMAPPWRGRTTSPAVPKSREKAADAPSFPTLSTQLSRDLPALPVTIVADGPRPRRRRRHRPRYCPFPAPPTSGAAAEGGRREEPRRRRRPPPRPGPAPGMVLDAGAGPWRRAQVSTGLPASPRARASSGLGPAPALSLLHLVPLHPAGRPQPAGLGGRGAPEGTPHWAPGITLPAQQGRAPVAGA